MTERFVTIDKDDAERRVRTLSVFLSDLRPFWPLVVPLATSWWRRQFDTEGAFGGRPWAPLSERYALIKQTTHPGKGLLVRTGAMRQAASRPERVATARELILRIDDPKLRFHQEGMAKMPARPLLFGSPLPPLAAAELEAVATGYIRDLLRRV